MGRSHRSTTYEDLLVQGLSNKGEGVAKTPEGKVIFVAGTVPGDRIHCSTFKKRKGVFFARLNEVVVPSPHRIAPVCSHFGVCGGCKLQHMDYTAQLEHKQLEVLQNLKKIAGVTPAHTAPIVGAPNPYWYRNKMEYSFSNNRWLTAEEINTAATVSKNGLGFHKPGMWDKIVNIDRCHLQTDPANAIRNFIRAYAEKQHLAFFNPRAQKGFLRTLMLRNTADAKFMVLLQFYEEQEQARTALLDALVAEFPKITSLLYCINNKGNDTIYDQDIHCYHGAPYLNAQLENIQYKITAKSFFQTNYEQALALYTHTRSLAALKPTDVVYDLYTGTGSIALFLAAYCKKIVGVEAVEEAVVAARENAAQNNITNTVFESGDMRHCFNADFIARHGKADVVVTDPPRDGMHPKVVAQLLQLAPKKIVYVSCNSATQARDLALLKKDYHLKHAQAVDMFPQTHHIENIVLLERQWPP